MAIIPRDAYILIIGAMKCGTSSLYMHLTQHEEICPCRSKEPEYFSENQGHRSDVDQYSDLWDYDPDKHRYVLEASTGYTKYPREQNVVRNIKESGISPTFIYIVRNPFDRIESQYNFSMNQTYFDPSASIADERYVNCSDYFLQLEQYREAFGTEKIWVLDFDEMTANTGEFVNSIFSRLGLPSIELTTADQIKNKTIELSQGQVFAGQNPRLKSFFGKLPRPAKGLVKRLYKPFGRTVTKRLLTNDEREIIHNKLAANMKLFGQQYEFCVEKWGF